MLAHPWNLVRVCSLLALCSGLHAHAQPVSFGEARSCLADMRRVYDDRAFGVPVRVRYIERMLYVPPDDELERLIEQVRGRPEHPERANLASYLARRRGEFGDFDRQSLELWVADRSLYRFCRDLGRADYFEDLAVDADDAWSLSNGQIVPSLGPDAIEIKIGESKVDNLFLMVMTPAARAIPSNQGEFGGEVHMLPDRTRVVIGNDSHGGRVMFSLKRGVGGRAVVSAVDIEAKSPAGAIAPRRVALSDHRLIEGESYPIPTVAVWRTASGVLERDYHVERLETVSVDAVRAVVQKPSAASPDPLRGWNGQRTAEPISVDQAMAGQVQPGDVAAVSGGHGFRIWHGLVAAGVVAGVTMVLGKFLGWNWIGVRGVGNA